MSWPATVPAIRRGTVPLPMVMTGTTMTVEPMSHNHQALV